MTWYFGLAIETGNREDADKLANYFTEVSKLWHTPQEEKVRTFQDTEDNWWCHIYFEWYEEQTPNLTYLYEALKESECEYRYAAAGLEVDEFRTYSELIEDLPTLDIKGLVISSKLAKQEEKNLSKIN